jgi:hypothetical protein
MRRNIIGILAAVIIVGGLIGFGIVNQDKNTDTTTTASPTASVNKELISYQGQDGQKAIDVLKASHTVVTEDSSFGPFVKGIDGLVADSAHYWAFYVNGQYATIGAHQYDSKSSDLIEWKYEAIQN